MTTARYFLLGIPVALTLMLGLNQDSADWLRQQVWGDGRRVLSSLTADLTRQNQLVKVVKVHTPNTIIIEFYRFHPSNSLEFWQRLELPDRRDAFMSVAGKVTNLAVDDVDGDSFPELIAPTFDDSMKARMNIIKFNAANGLFELVPTSPSI